MLFNLPTIFSISLTLCYILGDIIDRSTPEVEEALGVRALTLKLPGKPSSIHAVGARLGALSAALPISGV